MKYWWRSILLSVIFIGTVFTITQMFSKSNPADKKIIPTAKFPQKIPLSNWNLINSGKGIEQTLVYKGQTYRYKDEQGRILTIKIHQEMYTEGNVGRLSSVYTGIQPATIILNPKYREEVGHYALFFYDNQANLTACINPQGISTVSEKEFAFNQYFYGLSWQRFMGWTIGKNDLVDDSCLWTLLSIPLKTEGSKYPLSLKNTNDILERTWIEWYKYWDNQL